MSEPERLRRPAAPRTRSILEQMVARYAKHYGVPQARVRNRVSFMILAGVLERMRDEQGTPAFVVKGGVALELRLRLRARATKDFDTTFRRRFGDAIETLDRVLKEPYGDFTLARRGEIRNLGDKAKQVEVRLQYRGKPWATVQLEISVGDADDVEAEPVEATDLSEFGLEGPEVIHCLSARYQIAQKLHAVTAPPRGGRPNERFRDLLDLWLLRELGTDLRALREACQDVFTRRAIHEWPPTIDVPETWSEPFTRMAGEVGLPLGDVHEVAAVVQAYISEIASTTDRVDQSTTRQAEGNQSG